jgi:type IV pilus assembly protein PilM
MLAKNKFYGTNVISNLPNDAVRITSLRLAEEQEDKIAQVLRKEAAVRFGLEAGKDMVDYVTAGTVVSGDEVKKELILFAASDDAIRNHIRTLEEAKLRPVGIDAVSCALFRSCVRLLRRQEDREQTVVLLDVGSRYTEVVFSRGGEISFVKQIPVGVEKFNQQISARLGISVSDAEMLRGTLRKEMLNTVPAAAAASSGNNAEITDGEGGLDAATRQTIIDSISSVAEELAHEVSLCLRYYTVTFRGKRVERVIVTGGGAYEAMLLETFKQQLGVEIEAGQPLRGFDIGDIRFDGCKRDMLYEWAVAVGLSLKGHNPVPYVTADEIPQGGKRAFDSEGNYERN